MDEIDRKFNTDVERLSYEDTYVLLNFALSELRGVPEYRTSSEMAYILDKKNLMAFLEYFGGMTIKIPTIADFLTMTNAALLFEYIDIEGLTFDQALKEVNPKNANVDELKKAYSAVYDAMKKYDFHRGKGKNF